MEIRLDAHSADRVRVVLFCNHCGHTMGPFLMDDLLQPEPIVCRACRKSEPIFSKMSLRLD